MAVKIVADTNLIQGRGSFHFENGLWPVILAAIKNGIAELLVPEVVVQELVTHYAEEVKRSLRDLRKLHSTLGRLHVNVDIGQHQESEDEVTSYYEEWLRSHLARHGRILPLPTVSHERLLRDTLLGRKPLSRGDGGYRDALIWHSLLEIARETDGEIILLSENTRDFGFRTGDLSPDLEADVHALKSKAVVRLVSNLQGLVDSLIPEDRKAAEEVSKYFGSALGVKALSATLDQHFEDYNREMFTGRPRALPSWLLSPDTEGLQKIDEFQVHTAYKLGTDTWVVKAVLQGSAYVGGYTHPASLNYLDADQFEVWDHLGTEQVYVAYPFPQPIRAVVCFRWSASEGIADMTFMQLDLMTDHLTRPPEYHPASPRGFDPADACHWLMSELNRLLLLDPPQFRAAVLSEQYVSEIHSALKTVNSSPLVKALPPVEAIPIAPDNLGSMLTDHLGVQHMLNILGKLRFEQK